MADCANRREFLTQTTLAAAAGSFLLGAAPAAARTFRPPANERVRFASIGVGGKGESDTRDAGTLGDLVAICDINEESLDEMSE